MRVISGIARGRKLVAPEGLDVRPTTDKVKESIFNILQFELPDSRVLDLFAGSGQLGLEALSRGAASCTFIDNSARSLQFVKENLEHTGLDRLPVTLRQEEAAVFLQRTQDTFDIALLDPPYHKQILDRILPLLAPHLSDSGIILCETARDETLPETAGMFRKAKEYDYGKIKLTLFRHIGDTDE